MYFLLMGSRKYSRFGPSYLGIAAAPSEQAVCSQLGLTPPRNIHASGDSSYLHDQERTQCFFWHVGPTRHPRARWKERQYYTEGTLRFFAHTDLLAGSIRNRLTREEYFLVQCPHLRYIRQGVVSGRDVRAAARKLGLIVQKGDPESVCLLPAYKDKQGNTYAFRTLRKLEGTVRVNELLKTM